MIGVRKGTDKPLLPDWMGKAWDQGSLGVGNSNMKTVMMPLGAMAPSTGVETLGYSIKFYWKDEWSGGDQVWGHTEKQTQEQGNFGTAVTLGCLFWGMQQESSY